MVKLPLPEIAPRLQSVLEDLGHEHPFDVSIAGSAGSGRVYWRIGQWPQSHILLVSHQHDADYHRFLEVSRHLRAVGLAVPEIHASEDAMHQVVLEDLGSELFLSHAHACGYPAQGKEEAVRASYLAVVEALVVWQELGTLGMQDCPALMDRIFDREALLWETGYFSHRYLQDVHGLTESVLQNDALHHEFVALADRVAAHPQVLMHRDFQSQNLLLRQGQPWFIDYQGARRGSCWYDLASLLWDPYVQLSDDLRRELFEAFCDAKGIESHAQHWQDLQDAALQRVMQALGAYGFLTRQKGLPWFAQFMAPAQRALQNLLASRADLAVLREIVQNLPQG